MATLEEIADSGDQLATLRALRQKVARTIDRSESGRDIAALSRQLQLISTEIQGLEQAQEAQDTPLARILAKAREGQKQVREGRQPVYALDEEDPDELPEIRPPKEERGAEYGRY